MSFTTVLMTECEEALLYQQRYFSPEDAAELVPEEQSLARLTICTDALSNCVPLPRLSENVAAACADLLEACGATDGVLLRLLTQFLADISMHEDNAAILLGFGIPGCYLLVLQQWSSLTTDTLNSVFDFLSTMSISSARSRQLIRPCIPYILAAMERNLYSLEVLFSAAVTLSTLATLNAENCELIAQRDGMQTVIAAFYHAYRAEGTVEKVGRNKSRQGSSALLARTQTRRLEEQAALCRGVQKWCRDVLVKVSSTRSEAVTAALQRADFGTYGHCLPLDELKWTLLLDVAPRPVAKPTAEAVPRRAVGAAR